MSESLESEYLLWSGSLSLTCDVVSIEVLACGFDGSSAVFVKYSFTLKFGEKHQFVLSLFALLSVFC